jgi:hypothetical protein
MREIKFRAWNEETKEMINLDTAAEGELPYTGEWPINAIFRDLPKHWSYVFIQYTGLHDKNGKEIYEGDILGSRDGLPIAGAVEWRGCGFVLVSWRETSREYGITADGELLYAKNEFVDDLWAYSGVEVMGNIYENPELLEK